MDPKNDSEALQGPEMPQNRYRNFFLELAYFDVGGDPLTQGSVVMSLWWYMGSITDPNQTVYRGARRGGGQGAQDARGDPTTPVDPPTRPIQQDFHGIGWIYKQVKKQVKNSQSEFRAWQKQRRPEHLGNHLSFTRLRTQIDRENDVQPPLHAPSKKVVGVYIFLCTKCRKKGDAVHLRENRDL